MSERSDGLDIKVGRERDGTVRLTLGGELDLRTGRRLDAELARIETQLRPGVLILDLANLTFIDSSGLRVLFHAERRARAEGRRIVLVPGSGAVRRVFEITGALARFVFEEPAADPATTGPS